MLGGAGSSALFVGRGETVEALTRRLEDARGGSGGVTLLVGDTGVGKSTLLSKLCQEIRTHGVRVLMGRAMALDEPPPYSLLQSALESASDDPTIRQDDDPPVTGGQYLIGFAPMLSEVDFPAPVGIEVRLLGLLGATDERGRVSPDEILAGIAERFLALTRHGPTVVILDDLDRADGSTLAAVEFFSNELKDRPLWILAASRPFGSLSEAGRERLETFERATRAERIVLPPLTSGEVAQFLRMHDPAREFSSAEVERRHSETGGNPLMLLQIDRRGAPRREEPAGPSSPLPALDESAQRTLDVASVLGSEFPFGLLLSASGEEEEHLTEDVERLVSQGILFERPGELLEFPKDRLREEAYSRLGDSRRRLLHRRAGEALEATGSSDSRRVFALARHFYLGREARRSARYNRMAAEVADRSMAPDVARDHLARALESFRDLALADRTLEWELVLELSRVTYDLGRLEDAERILRDFLDRSGEDSTLSAPVRATLEVFLAQALVARGELPAAAALATKVLAAPGLEDQPLVRIGALHQLGLTLYYQGDYATALARHTEEIRLAGELGNDRVIAHARLWRAGTLAITGDTEGAIAEARAVAIELDRQGSVRESAQGHLFLGNILADTKSPEHRAEALVELEVAIRLGEQAQDPRRVGWAHSHAGELLRDAGRYEEARDHIESAREILGRIGDRTGLAVALKVRGQIATESGAYDRAKADLAEAYGIIHGLHQEMIEVDVVLRMAQLCAARGDRAGAEVQVAELERQHLPTLRSDLAVEFERLKRSLSGSGPPGGGR
jgi:tetratricopeptide (TPR) repeat protein